MWDSYLSGYDCGIVIYQDMTVWDIHLYLVCCLLQGMVQAAVYIKKKIKEEMLLSAAFGRDLVSTGN